MTKYLDLLANLHSRGFQFLSTTALLTREQHHQMVAAMKAKRIDPVESLINSVATIQEIVLASTSIEELQVIIAFTNYNLLISQFIVPNTS